MCGKQVCLLRTARDDVNTQNSILLVCGEKWFIKLIDYPEVSENAWKLDGVVSRKKQLLPYLTGLLARG